MTILDANLSFRQQPPLLKREPFMLVIHSPQTPSSMQRVHDEAISAQGWLGIGYHYWITEKGDVYQARDPKCRGAHCTGYNDQWGVALAGDCRKVAPTAKQYAALTALIYHLSFAKPRFEIALHRDLCDTDCPGTRWDGERLGMLPRKVGWHLALRLVKVPREYSYIGNETAAIDVEGVADISEAA
jgi:N-acetylmuramoyl-L-alanine amidase